MSTIPPIAGTDDARDGYAAINNTRDYIEAWGVDPDGSSPLPLARGGIGSGTAAGGRANLGIPTILGADATASGGIPTYSPALTIAVGAPTQPYHASTKAYVDAVASAGGSPTFTNLAVTGSMFNSGMAPVVSSYVAMYRNGDGRLGITPSTRRAKKDIAAWAPDRQAVLALEVVTFHYKAHLFAEDDPNRSNPALEVGLIAEDVAALGLEWLVWRDDDGLPAGIHYERIALALIPVLQDHETRLRALEDRV